MPYRDTWVTCEQCGRRFVFTVEEQRRQAESGIEVTPAALCANCDKETELSPGPHEGVVKWYDPEKGYGFIVHRGRDDIFFHRSGITVGGPESFADGTRVTYLLEQTQKGPQAIEVALAENEEEMVEEEEEGEEE